MAVVASLVTLAVDGLAPAWRPARHRKDFVEEVEAVATVIAVAERESYMRGVELGQRESDRFTARS